MGHILLLIILLILLIEFGLGRWLSYLNIKHSKSKLPAVLADIYDAEKYARQQDYFRTNTRFGMLTASFSFVVIVVMYACGGFGWFDGIVQNWTDHSILQSLLFFGVLFIVSDIITIPFQWYATFVIEEKFGFNKQTPSLFIADKLKSWGLSIVLGGLILTAIIWIYNLTPEYFWLLAFGVVTVFSLFMNMFYSELIVPLFNKQTPLEEGELRTAIEAFANKSGFQLKNIYMIDGSKRSTKANAYFTGLGPKKRIVLYDTLTEQMDTDEIVAVLAHEIGHYKHKHVLKGMLYSIPSSLLLFFLLGWMLGSDVLAQALGGTKAVFHLNAIAFFTLYTPISLLLGVFGNVLSRKHEYEADAFAQQYGYGEQLISGLKKLSSQSLSNLMPHPLYVFFNYSHPTLYQRIIKMQTK
ncbi:MAG: M48 family metallopeptidase [Bacteroidales bacterium]|jgi:STE24 endopeptidase|nr:M48 family metallopeptidase [Bacteroidales bacterium]HOS46771.1 M48 family metallopeptidase [Paludibacter sp.]